MKTVFVLRDGASGNYCGGVDIGRKSVLITSDLDHAEAWATEAQAGEAAAALGQVGGMFAWEPVPRQGDVAARLMARLLAGPASIPQSARGVRRPGELTEGQFAAVREMLRLLLAAQRHIDAQKDVIDAAGIRLDERPFLSLMDRLQELEKPFHGLMVDHFAGA